MQYDLLVFGRPTVRHIHVVAGHLTVRGNNSVEDIQCRFLSGNACKRRTTVRTSVRNVNISFERLACYPRMCVESCSQRARALEKLKSELTSN